MQLWEFHQLGTEARLMPDGTMRTLVTANTVDWNFLITDGNLTLQLNPTNSTVQGLGFPHRLPHSCLITAVAWRCVAIFMASPLTVGDK